MSSNLRFQARIGAEARVDLVDWQGEASIRKIRIPKSYRSPNLDKILRKRRTKEEVEILHQAKLAGVDCPKVIFADPEACEIIMEYVEGKHLKDLTSIEHSAKWFKQLGESAAKMHEKAIIHGDLTTKNIILSKERLVLIDFGLSFISERLEDKAEDLHLLKQAFKSTYDAAQTKRAFDQVMKGYSSVAGERQTKEVLGQIAKIEARGRYARVD